jgi:hypothetical protein
MPQQSVDHIGVSYARPSLESHKTNSIPANGLPRT